MALRESASDDPSPRRQSPVVIRFAGDSGDGMQLTGDRFTAEAAAFGNDLSMLALGAQTPRPRTGERPIADLRRAAKVTQRELALHLGVSVRTVAHWEAGTRPVPLAAAPIVARLLRRPLPSVLAAAHLGVPRVPSPDSRRPAEPPRVLAVLRRSSGWSAAELGRRVGVSGWTTGRPPVDTDSRPMNGSSSPGKEAS
jgi:transcriptional regulator with XRE-family HTH domain